MPRLQKTQRLLLGSTAAAAAKLLQSCPTLCNPRDSSPPGSPVPGILQARTLEWVAISFSSAWKWKVKGKSLSRVRLLATPWTAAYQAPLSMGFSRQEYWSRVPLPGILGGCKWSKRSRVISLAEVLGKYLSEVYLEIARMLGLVIVIRLMGESQRSISLEMSLLRNSEVTSHISGCRWKSCETSPLA